MNENLVEITNVTKIFDPNFPPALNNISAVIPKGKMVGLAGPDGAGKTTLIRLIAGLLHPTQGDITVGGFNTKTDPASVTNLLSYMPQRFGLYEDLTVEQNLNLYADLQGVVGDKKTETFNNLYSFTQLAPFKQRLAGNLSGGMKQKLGLACALIRRPSLLLLDEPSVGVDPISRRELWKMVKELLSGGVSVVWSTAYLDEAERCDVTLLLNDGKLLFTGTPEALTKRVEGRVFMVSNIVGSRRQVLSNALNESNVLDGTIQADVLRIVTREKKDPPIDIIALKGGDNVKIEATKPRFEDAFIDILGGGPGGTSALAQKTPEVSSGKEITIEAENLTKKFGSFTAADQISFKIKRGEIFGLLGPNGAGKSTTFKMLCGLLKPTEGEAFVNGLDLQVAPSDARAQIGYMAQKFSLYGDLSVYQNLNFFSGIYNLQGQQRQSIMQQMIEIFNFQQYLETSASTLPLGYKQRLALACATMHHPKVLFLDEPTSGVDPITRREFWNHINGLVEKGVTVMVTTHFMDEAEYCDRIALVYKSKIIAEGTPNSLKERSRSKQLPNPTLEDAFVELIEHYDRENHAAK